MFNGKILQGEHTLEICGIEQLATIRLGVRLRGGGACMSTRALGARNERARGARSGGGRAYLSHA
jgi:hypothetical protein